MNRILRRAARPVPDRLSGRPEMVCPSFQHPESATNRRLGSVRDRVTGCPEFKGEAVEVERAEGVLPR